MVFRIEFEKRECTRCGGSGRFSFTPEYGDKCFKCAGNTTILSTAGSRAFRALEDLLEERLSKEAQDIKQGDLVWFEKAKDGFKKTGWYEIAEVTKKDDYTYLRIAGGANYVVGYKIDSKRRVQNIDLLKETMREVAKNFKGATLIES